jgi:hypothetical protein
MCVPHTAINSLFTLVVVSRWCRGLTSVWCASVGPEAHASSPCHAKTKPQRKYWDSRAGTVSIVVVFIYLLRGGMGWGVICYFVGLSRGVSRVWVSNYRQLVLSLRHG